MARHEGEDADVPGRALTFAPAQARPGDGDLETLRGHGLPAERVTLPGDDPAGALRALTAKIKEML